MSARYRLNYLKTLQVDLPPQGSDAWLKGRMQQFGGSEMASVLGCCPFEKIEALIEKKKNRERYNSAECAFGRIFEDVAKKYLTTEFKWDIHEFSAIRTPSYPVSYSPDGIRLIDENTLSLLEIKCPFRRYKLEKIPDHYAPQINTGVSILPVDYGEFLQFRFRLCKCSDIENTPTYNRWLHWESKKRIPNKPPVAYGYVEYTKEGLVDDYGCLPPDKKDELMTLPPVEPHQIHVNPTEKPKGGKILGWKLFEISIIRVSKDLNYLENVKDKLWDAYSKLTEIKNIPTVVTKKLNFTPSKYE